MSEKIFLSHSSEDRRFVEQLAADLERQGIPVWYSGWEIRVGDSIVQKIDQALDEMGGLVVALSRASVQSKWVREELSAGLTRHLAERDIGVFPVRVDDCDIPPLLSHRRYADFSQGSSGLSDLIEAILPTQNLIARVREVRRRYIELVDSLQNSSISDLNQKDWRPIFEEMYALLEDAVRIQFQVATRLDRELADDSNGFFEKFEYLVNRGYSLRSPEWAFLVTMRNYSVHNARMYMSHARQELERLDEERWCKGSGEKEIGLRFRETLQKLRGVFDSLME